MSAAGGWKPLEDALFWLTIGVWALLVVISVRSAPLPLPPVQVDTSGAFPVAVGFHGGSSAEQSGLRIGDRLLRVEDRNLRGAGPIELHVLFEQPPRQDGTLAVRVERAGRELRLSVPVVTSGWVVWPILPASLGFALAALAARYRAPPSRFMRAATLAMLVSALVFTRPLGPPLWMRSASIALLTAAVTLQLPLTLRAIQLFPAGRKPRSRLARALPWLFVPYGVLGTSYVFGVPLSYRVGSPRTTC